MKYGYNLFSAWSITKDRQSLLSTIKALKDMGYDGVELFLYSDIPVKEMKVELDKIGINAFSSHPRLLRFFNNLEEEINYAKGVGIETLVMPHVPDEERTSEYYQKILSAIPQWKKKCDEAGIRLAWHNHEFEFVPYEGRRYLMDAILTENPGIDYEIDTFWTTYAGVDTIALMEAYKSRIRYIHFKDYKGKTGDGYMDIDFCAVGEGMINVKIIAEKAKEIGVEWAVVEQDTHTKDVLEDARISLTKLKELFES